MFRCSGRGRSPFDCDTDDNGAGKPVLEVPETNLTGGGWPNGFCDAPNVLNHACDPGSRFQVLKETNDVAIVGHCRKHGHADHEYGDIAVIQYNKKNGAICFYQALADDPPHPDDPPEHSRCLARLRRHRTEMGRESSPGSTR